MSTAKAEADEAIRDVETFCRYAAGTIGGMTPIGFGEDFRRERDELIAALDLVATGFKRSIRRAQRKHGWAKE